jgi:hypothetical protein
MHNEIGQQWLWMFLALNAGVFIAREIVRRATDKLRQKKPSTK